MVERIVAEVDMCAMRRAPACFDLDPEEAFFTEAQHAWRSGVADQHGIARRPGQVFQKPLGPGRPHRLFVARQRKHDLSLPVRANLGEGAKCDDRGGDTTLHVGRAAAVEAIAAQLSARIDAPGLAGSDGKGVEMPVEDEATSRARAPDTSDEVDGLRDGLDRADLRSGHVLRDDCRSLGRNGRGRTWRVGGRHPHEPEREVGDDAGAARYERASDVSDEQGDVPRSGSIGSAASRSRSR